MIYKLKFVMCIEHWIIFVQINDKNYVFVMYILLYDVEPDATATIKMTK